MLPDIVIDTTGEDLGLLVCEGRSGQVLPEVIQNKDLNFGLCAGVLCPVVHRRQQLMQRREERLAGLLELVAVGLAEVLLEYLPQDRAQASAWRLLISNTAAYKGASELIVQILAVGHDDEREIRLSY